MVGKNIVLRKIQFDNEEYLLVAAKDNSNYRKKFSNIEGLIFDFSKKEGKLFDKIFNRGNLIDIDVYSIKNEKTIFELNKIFKNMEYIDMFGTKELSKVTASKLRYE